MKDKHIQQKKHAQAIWVGKEILDRQKDDFYGKMTLVFEEGQIRRVVTEESKFPPTS